MDLRLSDEQQQLIDAFAALYGAHSSPEHVRGAEPSGFDQGLWTRLLEMGIVAMAVDEEHDGWGASLLDLTLIAEQQGRWLAPVPVIEAQVAARLLARTESDALGPVLEGQRLVTLALHATTDGKAVAVPAAAIADDAVVLVGDQLLLVPLEGHRTTFENLGSMPLADVEFSTSDAEVLVEGPEALALHDAAIDEWLVLTSAAMVGIGARSLEIGVDYVKERKAWGVPIGSFQAISHRLADSATAVDGGRLITYEASWAAAEEPDRASELAALAFAVTYEAARDATYRSLHFHGGYGFMMEYDIQLYWRRARGWAGVWGEPKAAYERAGDRRYR